MDFAIEADATTVRFWSSKRLPFEPKGQALEARRQLRGALAGLKPAHGLRGEFTSSDTSFCDIENVLLYNVGMAAFAATAATAISLVRHVRSPSPTSDGRQFPYGHTYMSVSDGGDRREAIVVRREFELPGSLTLAGIWHAARREAVLGSMLRPAHLGMRVELALPPSDRRTLPPILKVLLDGLVSSLHCHDGSAMDVVLPRLCARLEARATDVERSLMTGPAELGTRSLLHPFRDGVQWNPADDVFDQLDIVRVPSSTPSCRMDVFEL